MDQPVSQESRDICHRCLQPVPPKAARCPHCGDRLQRTRYVPFLLGIGGLLALVFVVFIMIKVIRDTDIENSPSPDQQHSTPRPDKKPPLNQ